MRGSEKRSKAALNIRDAILGDVFHMKGGEKMRETQGILRKERCIKTKTQREVHEDKDAKLSHFRCVSLLCLYASLMRKERCTKTKK